MAFHYIKTWPNFLQELVLLSNWSVHENIININLKAVNLGIGSSNKENYKLKKSFGQAVLFNK